MPVLEASTLQIPAVALNYCAANEVIQHNQTGLIANNLKQFEKHLEKLISDPELRKKLGRKAAKHTNNFSWKKLAEKYSTIFSQVMKKKVSKTRHLFYLTLLGLIVRALFLNRHAFWFDEAFSVFVAQMQIPDLLKTAATHNTPPLFYILSHILTKFSNHIWILRLLSMFFGLITIPFAFHVFRKLTDLKTAKLATLFLTLSPLHIYFSTEIRMYSLLTLLTLLTIFFFLSFLKSKNSKYLLPLAVSSILALYTHYYAFLSLLAINLLFFTQTKLKRSTLLLWIATQSTITLAFLPWLILIFNNPRLGCWCFHPTIGIPATFASFVINGMGLTTLKDIFFFAPKHILWLFTSSTIFISILAFKSILQAFTKKKKLTLTLFFTPLLIATTAGLFSQVFSPRALIIISPFFYLFLAQGIHSIKNRKSRHRLKLATALLFGIILTIQFFNPLFRNGSYIKKSLLYNIEEELDANTILQPKIL